MDNKKVLSILDNLDFLSVDEVKNLSFMELGLYLQWLNMLDSVQSSLLGGENINGR